MAIIDDGLIPWNSDSSNNWAAYQASIERCNHGSEAGRLPTQQEWDNGSEKWKKTTTTRFTEGRMKHQKEAFLSKFFKNH
jgi:glyoxylate carboligase